MRLYNKIENEVRCLKSTGFFYQCNLVTEKCFVLRYDKATIKKEVANMKIKLNPDQEIVNTIREGLKRTGGYCPCRRETHRGNQMYVPGV